MGRRVVVEFCMRVGNVMVVGVHVEAVVSWWRSWWGRNVEHVPLGIARRGLVCHGGVSKMDGEMVMLEVIAKSISHAGVVRKKLS